MILHILLLEDNDFMLNRNMQAVSYLARSYKVDVTIKSFTTINRELETYIKEHRIDIALLDIDVGKFDGVQNLGGIQVAQKLKEVQPLSSIIFITSHGECLPQANDILPAGFLSKPLDIKKMEELFFRIVMEKFGQNVNEKEKAVFLEISVNKLPYQIPENSILYICKYNRKVTIVTKEKTYEVNRTLSAIEKELTSSYFVRVSRDTIVNKLEIQEVRQGIITMSNDNRVEIPLRKHSEILRKLY